METFDGKSEGKKSIHRPETMFIKYLILAIPFRERMKFLCCYCYIFEKIIYQKKNAKNRAKYKQEN